MLAGNVIQFLAYLFVEGKWILFIVRKERKKEGEGKGKERKEGKGREEKGREGKIFGFKQIL